jgi:hypothetical protein
MLNLSVMTADRIERLEHYIKTYEHYCSVRLFLSSLCYS